MRSEIKGNQDDIQRFEQRENKLLDDIHQTKIFET